MWPDSSLGLCDSIILQPCCVFSECGRGFFAKAVTQGCSWSLSGPSSHWFLNWFETFISDVEHQLVQPPWKRIGTLFARSWPFVCQNFRKLQNWSFPKVWDWNNLQIVYPQVWAWWWVGVGGSHSLNGQQLRFLRLNLGIWSCNSRLCRGLFFPC